MEMKQHGTGRGTAHLSRLPTPGNSRLKREHSKLEEVSSKTNPSKRAKNDTDSSRGLTNAGARSISSSSLSKNVGSSLKKTVSSSNVLKKQPGLKAPVAKENLRTVVSQVQPKPASVAPKKRPAWDLKGRLQDMELYMQRQTMDSKTLQTRLTEYNVRINQLEHQNQQLSGDVVAKEMVSETAVQEVKDLKNKLTLLQQEYEDCSKNLELKIFTLETKNTSLEHQNILVNNELAAALKEAAALKVSLAELSASRATIRADLDNTKQQLGTIQKENERLNMTLEDRETKILSYQEKERDHETERRKLHNAIQELKGNIRVFVRVRPLLGDERLGNDGNICHMGFPDIDGKVLELDKCSDTTNNESMLNSTARGKVLSKYTFSLDKVFQPETSQADIFDEISHLVQSALDGYNVCIFAYGQTGSGKTYTMEGSLNDEATLGMIPRTTQKIFSTVEDLKRTGWQYMFQASMLEIYNETIRDLLGKEKEGKHEIKMCSQGESDVYVSNLTVMDVNTEDQVLGLLKKASKNRAVAETKSNLRSSRSHSVFQLKIKGANSITGESCKGVLNLIDLAGSEKVKTSGSEGQRLTEAQSINKSLSHLGMVITALANKDKHIPYRNSKLTSLLQNSLGGNSKTLMFVNVSPNQECFNETLNSLRFAMMVNQCNIGTAKQNR